MNSLQHRCRLVGRYCGLLAAMLVCSAAAMNFQVLHNFDRPPSGPWPGVVRAGDGNLYGVTDSGGTDDNGVVFRVSPAGAFSIVHSFLGAEGSGAEGRLALGTNGWLYGTTFFGGPFNAGTVFKVSTNGQFVTLAYFSNTNGVNPQTGLVLGPDSNFYGTTYYGGSSGQGALFRVSHAGNLQSVFSFSGNSGVNPGWNAQLCRANDGNLYGTTRFGGTNGIGVVFKMDMAGNVSTVVDLGEPLGTWIPLTGLVQSRDGALYGTTTRGGDYGNGTLFKLDLAGNFTRMTSFDGTNGWSPESSLIETADGTFYAGSGSQILEITHDGVSSILHDFTSADYTDVEGMLLDGGDGFIYGTWYNGGAVDRGFIFKFTPAGDVETLSAFTIVEGSTPEAGLAWGPDGNIYGLCIEDGLYGGGTLFRMSPGGVLTNIYNFDNTNGGYPNVLVAHTNGLFYGTTESGGPWGGGTVFQATTNGDLTLLGSLDGTNGSYPQGLLRAGDGSFYGTTLFGGPSDAGVVFKIDTDGALSTVYPSTPSTGNYPLSILQGQDGSIYGTADNGPYQGGVVWKLTANGDYSLVNAFAATSYFPGAGLVQDSAGLLYGVLWGGSQPVFCLTTNGSVTSIGSIPDYGPSGPVLGADGNFYGASWLGGPGGQGSVWAMNRNGRLVRLVSFDNTNGASVRHAPLLGGDGRLYGTTEDGGAGGGGVVYTISFADPEILGQPLPKSILSNGSALFDVVVFSTNAVSYQWRRNGLDIPGATQATFSVVNAQPGDFGIYSVVITSGANSLPSAGAALTLLPANPLLTVARQQQNVLLSWPNAYTGFNLLQSSNAALNSWSVVGQTVSSNADTFSLSLPVNGPGMFYRLMK